MDTISTNFVTTLLKSSGPVLSLYLPTDRTGESAQQNRIRYKNLLGSAADAARQWNAESLLDLAAPLYEDNHFWSQPKDGVAVFAGGGVLHALRLPVRFDESARIGARPYIKPLLPLLEGSGPYHLLAVSENCARLYRGSKYELSEVKLDELPQGVSEVLREHPESQMLVHTGQPALRGKEGRVVYGEGGVDVQKKNLEIYLRAIDRALAPYLRDLGEQAPLVFCGVKSLFPDYRKVATYPHLYEEPITGNFDRATTAELLVKANEVLTPHWAKQRELDRQAFEDHLGGPRTSADIESMLPAAFDGKIAVLFVASNVWLDGTYDAQTRRCTLGDDSRENEDLLNVAATQTLLHGGRVYAVKAKELPAGIVAAALYRYS